MSVRGPFRGSYVRSGVPFGKKHMLNDFFDSSGFQMCFPRRKLAGSRGKLMKITGKKVVHCCAVLLIVLPSVKHFKHPSKGSNQLGEASENQGEKKGKPPEVITALVGLMCEGPSAES